MHRILNLEVLETVEEWHIVIPSRILNVLHCPKKEKKRLSGN